MNNTMITWESIIHWHNEFQLFGFMTMAWYVPMYDWSQACYKHVCRKPITILSTHNRIVPIHLVKMNLGSLDANSMLDSAFKRNFLGYNGFPTLSSPTHLNPSRAQATKWVLAHLAGPYRWDSEKFLADMNRVTCKNLHSRRQICNLDPCKQATVSLKQTQLPKPRGQEPTSGFDP